MFTLAYLLGAVAVILFLAIASLAPKNFGGPLGLIVGEDGRLSSSKFQFFLWTAVIVFSYVALYVANVENTRGRVNACPRPASSAAPHATETPSQPIGTTTAGQGTFAPPADTTTAGPWCPMGDLPVNVLIAMGLSLITLTAAKGITANYVNSGQITKTPKPGPPQFSDLIAQDGSSAADLSKVQMLVWTFIAAGTYFYTVVQTIPHFWGQPFPDISQTLMVLMGLGQGAYLGAKVVSTQSATITYLQPARGAGSGAQLTINGSGFGASPGTVKFGDVVAAPVTWTDNNVVLLIPQVNASGAGFKSGDTVQVGVLLQGDNSNASSNTVPYTF